MATSVLVVELASSAWVVSTHELSGPFCTTVPLVPPLYNELFK